MKSDKRANYTGTLYVSGKRVTLRVFVKQGVVMGSVPIARQFIGQHLDRLIKWFKIDRISKI